MSAPQPDSRSGMRFKELYTLDKVVSIIYSYRFIYIFALLPLIDARFISVQV